MRQSSHIGCINMLGASFEFWIFKRIKSNVLSHPSDGRKNKKNKLHITTRKKWSAPSGVGCNSFIEFGFNPAKILEQEDFLIRWAPSTM